MVLHPRAVGWWPMERAIFTSPSFPRTPPPHPGRGLNHARYCSEGWNPDRSGGDRVRDVPGPLRCRENDESVAGGAWVWCTMLCRHLRRATVHIVHNAQMIQMVHFARKKLKLELQLQQAGRLRRLGLLGGLELPHLLLPEHQLAPPRIGPPRDQEPLINHPPDRSRGHVQNLRCFPDANFSPTVGLGSGISHAVSVTYSTRLVRVEYRRTLSYKPKRKKRYK